MTNFRSGYVSLIGRPNVGKSTLLNALLGQKVSIVTEKPQTTRNRILGVWTSGGAQIIFIDTPGIHKPRHMLGEAMVKTVRDVLREIDIIIFITEPGRFLEHDRGIIESFAKYDRPVILLINKIDKVKKSEILPLIDSYKGIYPFKEIIPVSALKKQGMETVIENIIKYLPAGPEYYPEETVTDQVERSMVAEIIREKIMEKTSDELPYSAAVEVLEWTEREDGVIFISANIYVEREGQKGIIIGKNGKMLKLIGVLARLDIEGLTGAKVFLELWVKVRKGWRDDKKILDELGYN